MSLYDKWIPINDRFIITTYKHVLYTCTKKRLSTFDIKRLLWVSSSDEHIYLKCKEGPNFYRGKKKFSVHLHFVPVFLPFSAFAKPRHPSVRDSHRTYFHEVSYLECLSRHSDIFQNPVVRTSDDLNRQLLLYVRYKIRHETRLTV